jgi:MFS family permease
MVLPEERRFLSPRWLSLYPFAASSVNIALPSVGEGLSLDAVTLGRVATAYLLSSAAFLVHFGRIADIYGRKKIFTGGLVVFTLASRLSGIAASGAMLISFRVLQGIGVAMFAGTGVALLTSAFPAPERGKVLGINVATVYTGLALGPVLGGVLTQHLGWRSVFFLTVPLGLAIIGIVLWKLKGEWSGAKGEKFDFAGSIIYGLALVALAYGLTLLPEPSGVWLVVGGMIGLSDRIEPGIIASAGMALTTIGFTLFIFRRCANFPTANHRQSSPGRLRDDSLLAY